MICFRCLFYADDILLLCPSVSGLQSMLHVCVAVDDMLSLRFNPLKSYCIVTGKFASFHLPSVMLDNYCPIQWVTSAKYLGVYIVSGRKLSFDITPIKQAFLLLVTLFMLRLKILMNCCICHPKRAIVCLF